MCGQQMRNRFLIWCVAAVDSGINYFDLFLGTPTTEGILQKGIEGSQDKICLAGHLGYADKDGQYVKTKGMKRFAKDFSAAVL